VKNNKGSIETYRIISKLSKRDILRLARMTCSHSHSYLVHPRCALKDKVLITSDKGKTILLEEKIGFLDIECLIPGTLILTEKGLIPINKIKKGDKVLTHKNRWQKVTKVLKRFVNEKIFEIGETKIPTLKITKNHPLFVMNTDWKYHSQNWGVNLNKMNEEWVKIKELTSNHLGTCLIPDENIWKNIEKIYIGKPSKFDHHYTSNIPEELELTDNFLTVIGLFLGDGSTTSPYSIEFFPNKKDKEFIRIIKRWAKEIGASNLHIKDDEDTTMKTLRICSKRLYLFFKQFYNSNKEKYLPLEWLNIPDDKLNFILKGLCLSDRGSGGKNKISIALTSTPLIKNLIIRLTFSRNHFHFNAHTIYIEGEKRTFFDKKGIQKEIKTNKNCHNLLIHPDKKYSFGRSQWNFFNYIVKKIRTINKISYKGEVYNLEVENDNSYIANGFIVHNCFTFNFKADMGILLSYVIKELDGEIKKNIITPKELKLKEDYDKRLVKDLVKDLKSFTRIVSFYGCVDVEKRVLTSNLEWKPIKNLKIGDKLVGFDEMPLGYGNSNDSKTFRRHFKESIVEYNKIVEKPSYEIKFDNGLEIIASEDHPWLIKSRKNSLGGCSWVWKNSFELKKDEIIDLIFPPYKKEKDYRLGYLSALIDGEGSISQYRKRKDDIKSKNFSFQISFYNTSKEILERAGKYFKELGFDYSLVKYDKNYDKITAFQFRGGKAKKLDFLGRINPTKIKTKFDINKLGMIQKSGVTTKIKSIKFVGNKKLGGLQTSTRTYIVEGFGAHNTYFDLPFLRTKAVYYNLGFPIYSEIYHTDLWHIIKRKFQLRRNNLRTACNYFGIPNKQHEFDFDWWFKAAKGDKKALQYVLDHNLEDVIATELLWKKVNMYALQNKRSI